MEGGVTCEGVDYGGIHGCLVWFGRTLREGSHAAGDARPQEVERCGSVTGDAGEGCPLVEVKVVGRFAQGGVSKVHSGCGPV